jgi:hypothetical protein
MGLFIGISSSRRTRFAAPFPWRFREGRLQQAAYLTILEQFINDSKDSLFLWLPLTAISWQPLRCLGCMG